MKKFLLLSFIMITGGVVRAQLPDTVFLNPTIADTIFMHDSLAGGTRYLLQLTGTVSYWRDSVPPDSVDADAAFIYHLPYLSGFSNATIDTVNGAIGNFQYLPCNRSTCAAIPSQFICGDKEIKHNETIPHAADIGLDRTFLEISGNYFCTPNGSDPSGHRYWTGLVGQGIPAFFRFHDGDSNFKNNSGSLTAVITRFEPIAFIPRDTFAFGKVRMKNWHLDTVVAPSVNDSIFNLGSPLFPGCSTIPQPLNVTIASMDGGIGDDGFVVDGLNGPFPIPLVRRSSLPYQIIFHPFQKKLYTASISIAMNDPQLPSDTLWLTGEGIQGWLVASPGDTVRFDTVNADSFATQVMVLHNTGNDTLTITGVEIDTLTPAFTAGTPALPVIPPGGSTTLQVHFTPRRPVVYHSTLIIHTDLLGAELDSIALLGTGVGISSVASAASVPAAPLQLRIAPNPFTTHTSIQLLRDPNAGTASATMRIVDMLGRNVRTLFSGIMQTSHVDLAFDATTLPAGAYVCEAILNSGERSSAMMIVQP